MDLPILELPIQSERRKFYMIEGDTIDAIPFSFDVGDSIDLTGATIKIQLYLKSNKTLDINTTSGITITGTKSFEIDKIEKENNNLKPGEHFGDLEITDSAGDRLTYIRVKLTITKQYTV